MTGPEHDPEFEAFLKRRSPMYRRLSDIDDAEPPAELDRLVLNRARDAIDTPARMPFYRTSRWAMPAGLAATILIAFTVLLNIDRHEQKRERQLPSVAAAPAAATAEVDFATADTAAPPAMAAERSANDAALSDAQVQRQESRVVSKAQAPVSPALASRTPAAAPAVHADAESWLREIARLRAEGKAAEADRELEAFRRAYPSHSGASLATPPRQ
jgi:hypothetical protein